MAKHKKDSIVFYRSFYEAAKPLKDREELQLYRGIFEFGLNHNEIKMGSIPTAMFQLIKPQLEANYKKWESGFKGGRPANKASDNHDESIPEPSDNHNGTIPEPNVNVNVNDNDNDNVFITLQLNDKTEFIICDRDLVKWGKLYPAVDVEQELRNMVGWIDANPTRRKTKTGIKKFVNSWLSKEQDQGGRKQISTGSKKSGINIIKEAAR